MNPFKDITGLRVNGNFYHKKDLLKASMDGDAPAHLREMFAFAAKVLNKSATLKVSTSGSTGKPKKMEFPKEAFYASAKASNAFFKLKGNSHALLALPMRYIAGKMMVVRAIVGQYNLDVVQPSALPFTHLPKRQNTGKGQEDTPEAYDFVPLTPYQAVQGLDNQVRELRKCKAVLIGGGPVSDELRRRLKQAGVNAYASFGMTETLSHFALAQLSSDDESVEFHLLKGVEIKVRKSGLLRVKWKEVTRHWIDTNDLVAPLEGGKKHASLKGFTWLGRNDHLINSGGVKVIPELVEKRLAHLIHVPFFVAGVPHEKLGEEVALFIEAEGLPARDLLSEVQHVLSDTPFWQPRRLLAIDKFMYTPTGKVVRGDTVKKAIKADKSR